MSGATAGGRAAGRDGSHVAGRGKEFKSRVTSEERKRRNKKVDLGMRQQRGGEAQEEDCRGAHWRRSDEEGGKYGIAGKQTGRAKHLSRANGKQRLFGRYEQRVGDWEDCALV